MLRKVTPNTINVFIVTRDDCQARLKLYKHNGNTAAPDELDTGAYTPMLKIGAHMFVNVISLSLGANMTPGITYGYNVEFNIGGTEYSLWNISVYDGITNILKIAIPSLIFKIGGLDRLLPTFVLPPIDKAKLRVIHGSCRKPHGEGLDAMEQVYKILHYTANNPDNVTNPSDRRPQMMFLTGDQIYADDVSPILLDMINKYAQLLLGWDENLAPLGCDVANMAPGARADNIINVAKFSVDEKVAGSHLMKLREFIIMYCMVWSNALWKEDPAKPGFPALPAFADLFPGTPEEETKTYVVPPSVPLANPWPTQVTFKTGEFDTYEKQCSYLAQFYQALNKNMRAILANIPSYMICDDHEITDDLFYNGSWFDGAINNSALGKRICTSGMAAYALFQDWGNKPEDYISGQPGGTLLNYIYNVSNNNPDAPAIWNAISDIVLPELYAPVLQTPVLRHKAGSLNWHYYYEVSNAYEFLVLDTRTMRVFHEGNDGVPGLMSEDALTKQIALPGSSKSKALIFVISPTPVIGVNYIEKRKEDANSNFIKKRFANKQQLDLEHWSFDKKAYEHLYSKLFSRNPNATFLQVIMLGGDVHYAYSSRMQYWANQPYMEGSVVRKMTIAGLCASSFRNEVSASNVGMGERIFEVYTKAYHGDILDDVIDKSVVYGWQNLSLGKLSIPISGTSGYVLALPHNVTFDGETPATFDRNRELSTPYENDYANITNDPYHDWHYRIAPVKRTDPGYVPAPANGYTLDSYKSYTAAHRAVYEKAGQGGKFIVGYNNMGDIMLESGPQGIGYVYHQIWWASDEDRKNYENDPNFPDMGLPYTIHKIDMNLYNEPALNNP
ncbi:hypothetical protein [Taibaiella koreensis]|uniref:hypothetical protein n=1 Tax=Taibaiella koreensis TaxID=1268548 RepID=UPI000E59DEA8|nr:hypothetical protein [Taibaiella koreensis]